VLAAGGTGGHLFPAEALATELTRRGHAVELVTDERARAFLPTFPAEAVHMVPASTIRGRGPAALARMAVTNARGLLTCLRLFRASRPDVAVGFGGYPTLPPLNAARLLGIPVIVHEANAVMGRANRSLARRAHVATSFPEVKGIPAGAPVTEVGVPVRPPVRAAAAPYSPATDEFRLLVFGGSQGARAFADLVPPAVAKLTVPLRSRLRVTQQCRPEDLERVRDAYATAGIAADLAPFFADLPARMAAAHLVVARSGASTVAELAVIGRPALLVPLPGAIDQDQAHNASALAALGAAKRLDQGALSPERLANEIGTAMNEPEALATAAEAARRLAKPDAAERLADLAERVAAGRDGAERFAGGRR
jgi:UDP-N-acetylglucosamine--N-acetylmuramyl-(pentapeptide) pyrophosphoryl-undecaprenol N-acetylglucosamine transferase